MKTLLTIFYLSCNLFALGQSEVTRYHAQGRGYYPITVSASNDENQQPLANAKIRIELDKRLLLSACYEPNTLKEPEKTIDANFHSVQTTNSLGLASLFYIASWSDHSGRAIFVHRQGIVIIEAEGFQTSKIDLADLKTSSTFSHSDVLHLQVKLKPTGTQNK